MTAHRTVWLAAAVCVLVGSASAPLLALRAGADTRQTASPKASTSNARDVLGWRETRWGMTVERVDAALKGEGGKPDSGRFALDIGYVIRTYIVDADTLSARLRFGQHGLEAVTLVMDDDIRSQYAFERLETALAKKYGAPTNKSEDATGGHVITRRLWVFPSTTIELSLNLFYAGRRLFHGSLMVIYEPTATGDAGKL